MHPIQTQCMHSDLSSRTSSPQLATECAIRSPSAEPSIHPYPCLGQRNSDNFLMRSLLAAMFACDFAMMRLSSALACGSARFLRTAKSASCKWRALSANLCSISLLALPQPESRAAARNRLLQSNDPPKQKSSIAPIPNTQQFPFVISW